MSYNYCGRVALVTGSSSGIGRNLVAAFAKCGAQVIVTGRDKSKIETVVQECLQVSTAKSEIKVLPLVADLSKDDDVKKLIKDTIDTFGHLDILVNNAAYGGNGFITDDDFMSKFDSMFDVNVRGVLRVTKEAVPHLIQSKNHPVIINISSVASTKSRAGGIPYCTSKAAIDMITKCLTHELSPKGVRVNAVNPALIETPFFATSGRDLEALKKHQEKIYPIQRVGQVTDTTQACLYLASKEASFITGINLPVDGGYLVL